MKFFKSIFLSLFFVGLTASLVMAQTSGGDDADDSHTVGISIPEVAILDIEGGETISIGPDAPTEAGEQLDFSGATDNSLWLNYSSIVGSTTESSRQVTVAISDGDVPAGLDLKVEAATDAGAGGGTVGSPSAELNLDGTSQQIISDIGSCYTGDGVSAGHQLTYRLELESGGDYGDIDFDDSTTLTILYTISNN